MSVHPNYYTEQRVVAARDVYCILRLYSLDPCSVGLFPSLAVVLEAFAPASTVLPCRYKIGMHT